MQTGKRRGGTSSHLPVSPRTLRNSYYPPYLVCPIIQDMSSRCDNEILCNRKSKKEGERQKRGKGKKRRWGVEEGEFARPQLPRSSATQSFTTGYSQLSPFGERGGLGRGVTFVAGSTFVRASLRSTPNTIYMQQKT